MVWPLVCSNGYHRWRKWEGVTVPGKTVNIVQPHTSIPINLGVEESMFLVLGDIASSVERVAQMCFGGLCKDRI